MLCTLKAAEAAEGLTSKEREVGRVGRGAGTLARGWAGVMWQYCEQAQKALDRVRPRDPECQTKLGKPLEAKRGKKHVINSFVHSFCNASHMQDIILSAGYTQHRDKIPFPGGILSFRVGGGK